MVFYKTINKSVTTQQAGFTITELMIATLVFSVILLVITAGVTSFTRDYYKGINASATQNVATRIANSISQSIQFSDGSFTPGDIAGIDHQKYLCFAGKQFIYNLGQELEDDSTFGLISMGSSGSCLDTQSRYEASDYWSLRQELLQRHMRVTDLSVTAAGGTKSYNVAVTVAYGDSDLLCNRAVTVPTDQGYCAADAVNSYAPGDAVIGSDIACKTASGSQFCYVSKLSTVAHARLE